MYFTEAGLPLFCGIFFKKKRYVHFGAKAAEATLSKLACLASNNEVFFCYNKNTLSALLTCAKSLENFKLPNKDGLLNYENTRSSSTLTLLVNNKLIFIKTVQNFLNLPIIEIYRVLNKSWSPLRNEATLEEILSFYKEDSRVFSFFLKNLDFYLSQVNATWYLQSSIASVAFTYLKAYVNHADYNLYTSQHIFEVLKAGFRGGRNELYAPGVHENITILDFKSLYNKLLLLEFPTGIPVFVQKPENVSELGFYHVTVISNIPVPILPQKKESRVVYENGTFSGIFWCEELALFKENGGQIVKINYGLLYPSKSATFKAFAEICLKKRTSAVPLEKILYKTIVNSALGYLGFHSTSSQSQRYRNIAIPVIVASRGRIAWYQQYMRLMNTANRSCVYADTDSFFIKNMGQDLSLNSDMFNVEKLRTIVFFEKKKYVAVTQSGLYKHVGVASNLTLPAAIAHASACYN